MSIKKIVMLATLIYFCTSAYVASSQYSRHAKTDARGRKVVKKIIKNEQDTKNSDNSEKIASSQETDKSFALPELDIKVPEILDNTTTYTPLYRTVISNLKDNIKYYHHNFMQTYAIKFGAAYAFAWYYYYDLLYEKLGIFFKKYSTIDTK